jgi:hypothetical protein
MGACAARQVYEFVCARSGALYVAEPPVGVPLSALLSAAFSRALGSPVPLPLDALFGCKPEALARMAAALAPESAHGGSGSGSGPAADIEAAAEAGEPGSAVTGADLALVQLAPLRPYAAGAWRRRRVVSMVAVCPPHAWCQRHLFSRMPGAF